MWHTLISQSPSSCLALQDPYLAGTGYYGDYENGVGACYTPTNAFDASNLDYRFVAPANDAGLIAAIKNSPVDVRQFPRSSNPGAPADAG